MIDWEFLVPVAMGWALHHWWTVMTALAAVGGAAMRGGPRRRPGAARMSDRPKARPTPL